MNINERERGKLAMAANSAEFLADRASAYRDAMLRIRTHCEPKPEPEKPHISNWWHPVRGVDERDATYRDYPNIAQAARDKGISPNGIQFSISGGGTCGGFRWFSLRPETPVVRLRCRRSRLVHCVETHEKWQSVTEAVNGLYGQEDFHAHHRHWMALSRAIARGRSLKGLHFEVIDGRLPMKSALRAAILRRLGELDTETLVKISKQLTEAA